MCVSHALSPIDRAFRVWVFLQQLASLDFPFNEPLRRCHTQKTQNIHDAAFCSRLAESAMKREDSTPPASEPMSVALEVEPAPLDSTTLRALKKACRHPRFVGWSRMAVNSSERLRKWA